VRGKRTRLARTAARAAVALALLAVLSISASAHQVVYFWKYDPKLFWDTHSFKDHRDLRAWHERWHANHPNAGRQRHRRFHHRQVGHTHQKLHYHDVLAKQRGDATWYDLEGATGACGKPLKGLYAAHRKWKCGSLVSVRHGDRWVFVRIRDRGPYGEGRVIDLSKRAFRRLAPPSRGVIDVKIYRLDP
jgi:peptidoglycan lytic transglycosylase